MAKKNGNNKRQNHHHPNKKRGRREGGGGGKTPRKEIEEKTKAKREDTELTLAVVNRCIKLLGIFGFSLTL